MIPTLNDLSQRDLEEPARKIARAFGLTLEAMFGEKRRPAPEARARFYAHLRAMGWSNSSIGRFVGGKDDQCISDALKKYAPPAAP